MKEREGLALPLTLLALVIIGAAAAAAFFGASQRSRISAGWLQMSRAVAAGDQAQNLSFASLDFSVLDSLSIGESALPQSHSMPGGADAVVKVTRLQSNLWLMLTESSTPGGAGPPLLRATRLLVRLDSVTTDSAGTSVVHRVAVRVNDRGWAELY